MVLYSIILFLAAIPMIKISISIYKGKTDDEALIRKIGFKKNDDGVYDINLEGFFTDHCH